MNNIQLLKCSVHERGLPKGYARRDFQSYNRKPRIYVSPEGESLYDNLMSRRQRPSTMYRKLAVAAALRALGLPADTKVTWSHYAGCTMCPCSPGFIVEAACTHEDVYCTIGDPIEVEALAAKREQAAIEKDRERHVMHCAD